MKKLIEGQYVTEEDLILLGQLPDPKDGCGQFYSKLRSILLPVMNDPVVTLLALHESQEQEASLEKLFERAREENSAKVLKLGVYICTHQLQVSYKYKYRISLIFSHGYY